MPFTSETWVPAGHFYSPLVDPSDKFVRDVISSHHQLELEPDESLAIDDRLICETFDIIRSSYSLLPFPENPTPGFRYYYDNPNFSFGDAATYFGLLLAFRPRRVIEIGSGFSSCLLMDTIDRFFGADASPGVVRDQPMLRPSFIDPYPETLNALLGPDDVYRESIISAQVQDVPTEFFRELGANDILFIDSSHVAKTASDVNHYLFRILPSLRDGVIIHIHDIPYPFEYGPAWIEQENRSWNEAYAVRAFLQYNSRFEIIYFNHYMYRKHEDLLALMPMCLRNCGAGLWLRKRTAASSNRHP